MSLALLILLTGVFWGMQTFGQEWSAEQKEIINVLKTITESLMKGDFETIDKLWHKDGAWWIEGSVLPLNKIMILDISKTMSYTSFEIKPVEVKVFGNTALIQYYYSYISPYTGRDVRQGRGATTLIKQDGKWLAIGNLAASCSNLPPCIPMQSK